MTRPAVGGGAAAAGELADVSAENRQPPPLKVVIGVEMLEGRITSHLVLATIRSTSIHESR